MVKSRKDIGRICWGNFYPAKNIGLTCLVDQEGGKDLVPVTIKDAHKMTIEEIAKYINVQVNIIKEKKNVAH